MSRQEHIDDIIQKILNKESALSYSALSKFKKSPKAFIDYKIHPFEQTDDMLIGSVMHTMVLEPEMFGKRYISDKEVCKQIGGTKPRSTNAYKEWREALPGGVQVLTDSIFSTAKFMADALTDNKASAYLLEQLVERESTYEFEVEGLKFKSILDGRSHNFIIDLKKTSDAEPMKFRRDIVYKNYWIQGGTYIEAVGELLPYYILAVDKDGEVSVHELMEDFLVRGMEEFRKLVREFKHCAENGMFDYSYNYRGVTEQGFYKMDVPPYLG